LCSPRKPRQKASQSSKRREGDAHRRQPAEKGLGGSRMEGIHPSPATKTKKGGRGCCASVLEKNSGGRSRNRPVGGGGDGGSAIRLRKALTRRKKRGEGDGKKGGCSSPLWAESGGKKGSKASLRPPTKEGSKRRNLDRGAETGVKIHSGGGGVELLSAQGRKEKGARGDCRLQKEPLNLREGCISA